MTSIGSMLTDLCDKCNGAVAGMGTYPGRSIGPLGGSETQGPLFPTRFWDHNSSGPREGFSAVGPLIRRRTA